ncbi:Vegetative incompatibility protein HET-E-1 [Metarhizium brunneum]|uniref:Vegetative incompatibility protein HET-E-1 n=1 Tax=Metarhizium brunneum TaxID=500148 RepID=A0A7D5V452_9HYPO|nr:Vegetative incompatibility protein HET-E-1 [Metarhizium brunneum]
MYKEVLDEAAVGLDRHEKQLLEDVLRSIFLLFTPLSSKCLAALLGKNDRDVDCLLPNLHAVLDIQHGGPVKILHESFRDYLLDQEGAFRVDALETHMMLTRNCMDRMKRNGKGPSHGLHRDMYGNGDYSTTTNDIGHAINNFIPPDLEYACLNWVNHLQSFQQDLGQIIDEDRNEALLQEMPALLKEVKTLLDEHLLHWIETLSLLGRLSDGISSIKQLRTILLSRYDAASNFDAFLRDAERFALSYGFMIERFPLQTYGAALTFCPTDSQVSRRLGVERYPDIPTLRGARIGWDHCLYTLKGHGGSVNAIASSSSRKILASASSDRTVRLWDDVTGAHKRTLQGHRGYVLDIAFSPDGNTLVSASSDCQVWVWGVNEGNHIRTLEGHRNWVNSVVFLSNSTIASASSDWTINLWDINHGICKTVLKSHSGSVNALASSRNGKVLASGSSDRTVRIWNIAEGTPIMTSLDHDGSVTALSFATDGRFLASASSDKAVRLWDADTGSQIRMLEFHGDWVNSVTFINNITLATASSDRTLRLWNITTDNTQKFEGPGGWFNSTAFLADRNILVAASSDRTLRMWDGIMGGSEQMREGHDGSVNAVAFSPDGTWLASASSDRTRVRFWDVDEGTLIKTLAYRNHIIRDEGTTEDHSRYVLAIAFSPNGKVIASGSSDWRVRLWRIDESVPLTTLEGHRNWVRAVAFSTDGKLLASASTDGTLCLWDVEKRNDETSIYEDSASSILRERYCDADRRTHDQDWVRAVVFSPDGKVLASTLTDGTVSLLDLNKVNSIRTHDFLAVAFSLDVFNGADYLFTKLADYLKNYLEQVIDETKAHTGEGLLTFYNREWPRYTEAAKYINHMFQYLDRFVGQATEEGTTSIYDVYTLHLVQWRSVIIGSISENIIEGVLGLVERKRNGEIIENGIIKRVVESFVSLDIDHDDPLTTYRYYFETPFLEATRLYYRAESKHYLAENGVVEYMRRAELRLDEEDELVRACLHHNTADPLRQICIQVLIAEHSEILRNNFQSLLDTGREEDMARTVNLLSRMPDGLAPLLSKFETHLRKAGLSAVINAASAAEKLESKLYVGPVSAQYHDLVRWALSEDGHRTRSSDNICRELVSQLDVCKWGSDKFPESLSKYNAKPTEAEGSADVISSTEDWIARDGHNLLCLPPDYRATCAARWNNILVLGHKSGLVSFFQLP